MYLYIYMLCIYIDVLQICIYECKSNTNTYTVYLYNTYYMHMIMLIFVYSIYIISSFFANPQSPAQHAQEHQLVVRVFGLREGELNENDWKCILENHWIGFLFAQGIQKVCPEREAVSKKVTGEESQFCRNETTIFLKPKKKIKDVQVISKSFGKRCANHLEGHTRMIRTNWQKKQEKTVNVGNIDAQVKQKCNVNNSPELLTRKTGQRPAVTRNHTSGTVGPFQLDCLQVFRWFFARCR